MFNNHEEAIRDFANKSLDAKSVEDLLKLDSTKYLMDTGFLSLERLEEIIESDNATERASEACNSLYKIIEDFTIWQVGKHNDELTKIKNTLKEDDKCFTNRRNLYNKLVSLPKFSKLDEDERLKLAMQLGALDFSELVLKE